MTTPDLSRATWRKASHSDHNGGACVEIADVALLSAHWRKASRSGAEGGECVEVADLAFVVAVRDSKDADGPALILGAAAWRGLARRIKDGGYDRG